MSHQPPPSSSQQPPQYAYSPPPAELPYYHALFAAADKSSSGYLSGQTAVEFFFLSKLPIDLLKQIWTMADQPPSNTLDPRKFYAAVRLIQLFQNGKKPIDLSLNVGEADRAGMRAPFFEGVDVQAAMAQLAQQPPQQQQQMTQQQPQQQQQMPQQQQQPPPQMMPYQQQQQPSPPMMPIPSSGSTTILAVQDPYTMTPQELSRYEALFPSYAQPDPEGWGGYVSGAVAVELFGKSGKLERNGGDSCFFSDFPCRRDVPPPFPPPRLFLLVSCFVIICHHDEYSHRPTIIPLPFLAPSNCHTANTNDGRWNERK